jgi:hypothetical protein
VARIVEGPRLERFGEKLLLVAKVQVPQQPVSRIVEAEVSVVVEGGGRESDPPAGAATPAVTGWRSQDNRGADGPKLTVGPNDVTDWWVYATHVADAVVRFKVTERSADAD